MNGPRVLSIVIVGGLSLLYLASAGWQQRLAYQLDERGVRAEALVVSCWSHHHNVTYEYQVPTADGSLKTLTDSDGGGCQLVGQRVAIRYLPERPALSQRDRPYPGLISFFAGLVFFAGALALLRPRWEELLELAFWWAASYGATFLVVAMLFFRLSGRDTLAGNAMLFVLALALCVTPVVFVLLRRLIRRLEGRPKSPAGG